MHGLRDEKLTWVNRTVADARPVVEHIAPACLPLAVGRYEVRGVRIMVDDFATQEQLGLLPDGCTTGAVTWEYPPFQEITRLNAVKWLRTADGSVSSQAPICYLFCLVRCVHHASYKNIVKRCPSKVTLALF